MARKAAMWFDMWVIIAKGVRVAADAARCKVPWSWMLEHGDMKT